MSPSAAGGGRSGGASAENPRVLTEPDSVPHESVEKTLWKAFLWKMDSVEEKDELDVPRAP